MKKITLPLLLIVSLISLSFFQGKKEPEFQKIGENLYEAKTPVKFSKEDDRKLRSLLSKHYGIKEFGTEQEFSFLSNSGGSDNPKASKWWAITNKKWSLSVFSQKAVAGEGKADAKMAQDIREITSIIQKYAR